MSASRELAVRRPVVGPSPHGELDFRSRTPLYQQISLWYRRAILTGRLRPGQGLPAVTALARELEISKGPVRGAYELLIAEGYCRPFGAGTCVSPATPDPFSPGGAVLADAAAEICLERAGARKISSRAAALCGAAQTWLQRSHGRIDSGEFPLPIWSQLVSRNARKVSSHAMGYGMGYRPLREALADHLAASHAVKCDPSQLLVTTGAQQALQISALALLDPQDGAWLEEPGYPGIRQALQAAAARLVPVPVDEHGLDVEFGIRAADRARAAYLTSSRQFPLGVTLSGARRAALLSWAARTGAWIVEDGYDSELEPGDNRTPSLQELDSGGQLIYVGTLNRVMFPSLRIGFAVIPHDLVQGFIAVRNAIDTVATPVLHQMAMTDFIREGHFSRHVHRLRTVYLERRRALVAAINAEPDGALEMAPDESGSHLTIFLPRGIDDVKVADQAAQAGLRVRDLSGCYGSRPAKSGVVLDLAGITVQEAPAAAQALHSSMRALQRQSGAAR